MKKVLSVLLIMVLVLNVTGCGKKKNEKDKYDKIYCEKSSNNIKETMEISMKKPKEVNYSKETSFENESEYKAKCSSFEDILTSTAYNGVVDTYKCDDEKKVVTEYKKYVIADAKMSFDFSYIKKNGELDDKEFIAEYEIDGYKCEYK